VRLTPLSVEGAYVIDTEPIVDERGSFARAFCAQEMAEHGLEPYVAQTNLSTNARAGTLRGLHYRLSAPEAKTVRCTVGAVYDVLVDLRPESPTFLQHSGTELRAEEHRAVYVPSRCAHAYLTLTDGAEVLYTVSGAYEAGAEWGLRYDDPRLAVRWPAAVAAVSEKDAGWPLLPAGDLGPWISSGGR